MIKVAFFDVDGTLLSHKTKSVPQSTRRSIEKLKAAGIRCVVATGRQISEMEKLPVADMSFDGYITLNGQLVLDAEKRILHGTPITGETKEFLLRQFSEHRLPIMLVEEDRVYVNFVDDRVVRVQENISSPIPPLGKYTGKDLYQICVYLGEADEPKLAPIVGKCEMTRWDLGGVDVIAKGGGKVTGIRRYLEANHILPEETIAFGDGDNDADMLKFAGIGVAMGNGWASAKAAADYITADIDEDGIEAALKHFGLID